MLELNTKVNTDYRQFMLTINFLFIRRKVVTIVLIFL